jgi:SAM-dependent methyltransferase
MAMIGQRATGADIAVPPPPGDRAGGGNDVRHSGGGNAPAGRATPVPDNTDATNDYDLLPYPSMPITYTQPAHLAALATLFGIVPPAAECARVLELGCASGGNIIPLAARFPRASFLGIDLSHRHIADGNERIAALGLGNVRLEHGDLTTLDLAGAEFDYIICHGVFSWVPKHVQDAILRLCNAVLAPNGMVTISYNVLPGWHLRTAIRDLCLRYAGKDGTPQRRVARARAALAQIADASEAAEPYGILMRTEAARLKNVPASYILGEFLAPENNPCHVQDFIAQAADHGLDFLCEADLLAGVPPALNAEIRGRVTSFTNGNRTGAEQDIDFLTGRLFRRSVLVRQRQVTDFPLVPSPDNLRSLHVSSALRLDAARTTQQTVVFADDQGRPVSIGNPIVTEAMTRLAEVYPETLAIQELTRSEGLAPEAQERIRQAIFSMVLAGRVTLSVLPLRAGQADHERPTVWALARSEAASGQPWVTSLHHTGVPSRPVLKLLLPYLDGTHDRAALSARLADALQRGTVRVAESPFDQESPSFGRLAMIAGQYVEEALRYLAHHAFLEPAQTITETC